MGKNDAATYFIGINCERETNRKYIHVNTMGRRWKAKQLHKRPRKKPTQKETTQEPAVGRIADHRNPGIEKELREDTAGLRNCQTRKLTALYKLFGITLLKR